MGTIRAKRRAKLSTTVSAETLEFLENMVVSGKAASLADAVDVAIHKVRQFENRQRLAAATARYFDQIEGHALSEEKTLACDLATAASKLNFDEEL
jgi:Arc/MetJ-type ribon-helix-helix transcriptional regulator